MLVPDQRLSLQREERRALRRDHEAQKSALAEERSLDCRPFEQALRETLHASSSGTGRYPSAYHSLALDLESRAEVKAASERVEAQFAARLEAVQRLLPALNSLLQADAVPPEPGAVAMET